MLASSTLVSTFPPAFANQVPPTATPVNVDRTTMASTVKTSKVPSSVCTVCVRSHADCILKCVLEK